MTCDLREIPCPFHQDAAARGRVLDRTYHSAALLCRPAWSMHLVLFPKSFSHTGYIKLRMYFCRDSLSHGFCFGAS